MLPRVQPEVDHCVNFAPTGGDELLLSTFLRPCRGETGIITNPVHGFHPWLQPFAPSGRTSSRHFPISKLTTPLTAAIFLVGFNVRWWSAGCESADATGNSGAVICSRRVYATKPIPGRPRRCNRVRKRTAVSSNVGLSFCHCHASRRIA